MGPLRRAARPSRGRGLPTWWSTSRAPRWSATRTPRSGRTNLRESRVATTSVLARGHRRLGPQAGVPGRQRDLRLRRPRRAGADRGRRQPRPRPAHRGHPAWEAAARRRRDAGARVCVLRTAPVMDRRRGPLKQLRPLFQLGLGGRLGDGRQHMPMISLRDWVGARGPPRRARRCLGSVQPVLPGARRPTRSSPRLWPEPWADRRSPPCRRRCSAGRAGPMAPERAGLAQRARRRRCSTQRLRVRRPGRARRAGRGPGRSRAQLSWTAATRHRPRGPA